MGAINYRVHHRHTKSSASTVIDAQLPGICHVQFAIIFHMKFKDSRLDEFLLGFQWSQQYITGDCANLTLY